MKQTVRIIGGRFRGKKLYFPALDGLRPTPDRVRETLFNWLMNDIREACCLDAFAGSGALGFEAFSRGAKAVTLLEQDSIACANLRETATSFKSPNIVVKKIDAFEYLLKTQEEFDVIFLDPPFAKNYLPKCLELLTHGKVLKTSGLLYLEAQEIIEIDKKVWQELKLKQAGQVTYALYRKLL